MIDQLLKFFVTFLVVVEPIGVIPIFIAMTEGVAEKERRRMARKAVLIAGAIFLLFAIGGGQFLRLLGISLDAFRIFGGLLLLLIALEMVFARESGSRSSTPEVEEGKARSDISVFPLAFPFIAGPGSLTTILLNFGPASHDPLLFGGLLACVALALLCALGTLYLVTPINRAMGVTGANVLNRLFGVVLGALAAQYVLDGLRGSLLAPAGSG
ncbi:MAG TPA: MarC family protein [Steroidobacteraceae bacterium]|nr:MarC family protein [Steroidobacteraceae bacterium]